MDDLPHNFKSTRSVITLDGKYKLWYKLTNELTRTDSSKIWRANCLIINNLKNDENKQTDEKCEFTKDMNYVAKIVKGKIGGNEYRMFINKLDKVEGVIKCVGIEAIGTDDTGNALRSEDWIYIFYFLYGGVTLAKCLEDDAKPIDVIRRIEIINDIAKTLNAIANKQIIHLDVRPENILYDYETRIIRIIDFGVTSKYIETESTTERALSVMTRTLSDKKGFENTRQNTDWRAYHTSVIGYLAPECFRGKFITPKVYVYGIGMIACKLLGLDPEHVILNDKFRTRFDKYKQVPKEEISTDAAKLVFFAQHSKHKYLPPNASATLRTLISRCIVGDPDGRISVEQVLESAYLRQYPIAIKTPLLKGIKFKTDSEFVSIYEDITERIVPEMFEMWKKHKDFGGRFPWKSIVQGMTKNLMLKAMFSTSSVMTIGYLRRKNNIICWAFGSCGIYDRKCDNYSKIVEHVGGNNHGIAKKYFDWLCVACGEFHDPNEKCDKHYRLVVEEAFQKLNKKMIDSKWKGFKTEIKDFVDTYCNNEDVESKSNENDQMNENDQKAQEDPDIEQKNNDDLLTFTSDLSDIAQNICFYHGILRKEIKNVLDKIKNWNETNITECRFDKHFNYEKLISDDDKKKEEKNQFDLNIGKTNCEMKILLDVLKGGVKITKKCGFDDETNHDWKLKTFESLRKDKILTKEHTNACEICKVKYLNTNYIWICIRGEGKCRWTCCQDCMAVFVGCKVVCID